MTDLGVAAKLKGAFELSPTILAVTALDDGRIVEVNDAFLRVMGYTREEVMGRRVSEVGLWADPAQREEGLRTLRAGGSIRDVEARFRTKRGDELVVIASADVIDLDGRRCILTGLTDITARVRAEAALRESEQRFIRLFHANPLPMSIVRMSDGRHVDVNDAMVRASGYARDEILDHTTPELEFWAVPAERARLVDLLTRERRVRDFEMLARMKGGALRQMLVNAEVITYAGSPAVLNVALDITERKQIGRAHV